MDHKAVLTKDGSFSAYSEQYDEHYHSINDGALNETLHKHIVPDYILGSRDDIGIPNIVTSVLASYRGYDTFFFHSPTCI